MTPFQQHQTALLRLHKAREAVFAMVYENPDEDFFGDLTEREKVEYSRWLESKRRVNG